MKSLLLSILLAVTACSTPKETKVPAARDTIKPGAPTTLEVQQVFERSASLSLRFDGAGENVSVTVSGIEGLTVTSPAEALSGVAVKVGEQRSLAVSFTRGAGRGQLVISVRGTFNGATSSRVHTVAIGEGPPKPDGTKLVTDDGDAVKLMP